MVSIGARGAYPCQPDAEHRPAFSDVGPLAVFSDFLVGPAGMVGFSPPAAQKADHHFPKRQLAAAVSEVGAALSGGEPPEDGIPPEDVPAGEQADS